MVNNSSSFTITTMRRMNKRLYVWITTEHITTWTFATVDVLGMVTNLDKSAIEIMAKNLDKSVLAKESSVSLASLLHTG